MKYNLDVIIFKLGSFDKIPTLCYFTNKVVFFIGILLTKIFGSNAPSTPIKSSGQELVIKFKSQISGPYNAKNNQQKFFINYDSEYNGKINHKTHNEN